MRNKLVAEREGLHNIIYSVGIININQITASAHGIYPPILTYPIHNQQLRYKITINITTYKPTPTL